MQGPQNTTELRELLRPRAFPDGAQQTQTASDRLRDKAYEIGAVLFGLVPDGAFQQYAGNVLHDLVVKGEQTLCAINEVDVEHEPMRELRIEPATSSEPAPKPSRKKT